MRSLSLWSVVTIGSLAVAPLSAQQVIAVLGGNSGNSASPGAVVSIDIETGAATVLGTPLADESLTGVAQLLDGRVVASTTNFEGPAQLIEIDPETGALVATIGTFNDGKGNFVLHDLAVHPTTGVLYGVGIGGDRASDQVAGGSPFDLNALFEIDPDTGAITYVGTPDTGAESDFMAIAFTSDGTLNGVVISFGLELFEIDEDTGAVTSSDTMLIPATGAMGLGNLGNDTLILSQCCPDGLINGSLGNDINLLDPSTGIVTLLGPAGSNHRVHDFTAIAGQDADLAITKDVLGPGPFQVGVPFTYELEVTNLGPGDATGVVVTDPLPLNLTYVSNTCGASFAAPTLTWNVGNLAAAANATCQLTVTANAPGVTVNTAQAVGNETDPATTNNNTLVTITILGVAAIPTLGGVGAVALVAMLLLLALPRLRRRVA